MCSFGITTRPQPLLQPLASYARSPQPTINMKFISSLLVLALLMAVASASYLGSYGYSPYLVRGTYYTPGYSSYSGGYGSGFGGGYGSGYGNGYGSGYGNGYGSYGYRSYGGGWW